MFLHKECFLNEQKNSVTTTTNNEDKITYFADKSQAMGWIFYCIYGLITINI